MEYAIRRESHPEANAVQSLPPTLRKSINRPRPVAGLHCSIGDVLSRCRVSQLDWRETSIPRRVKLLRRFRHLAVNKLADLADSCSVGCRSDRIAAEVLPLLDACRFLERDAKQILQPRRLGRKGRPFWLTGVQTEVRREPYGIVLVIAPANYPLILPGIQTLQALAAGNAVLWKPAPGGEASAELMRSILIEAGLEEHLLHVLPTDKESVWDVIEYGVDHVVLTGSAATGRVVARALADKMVPSTMELSGCDAVFVTASADVDRVVDCLDFGLRLNGSQTCIAPRRVFAHASSRDLLIARLTDRLSTSPHHRKIESSPGSRFAASVVEASVDLGATIILDGINRSEGDAFVERPTVIDRVTPEMPLAKSDVFAPIISFIDADDPIAANNQHCPYALGATIFGTDEAEIRPLIDRVNAGCVVVNDMIVPTADPRVPFGGRGESGFGVTRGREGLEAMTQLKTVIRRNGRWLPHLDEPKPDDEAVLSSLVRLAHDGSWMRRMKAAWQLFTAGRR